MIYRRMNFPTRAIVAVAVMSLAIASCSSSGDGGAADQTTTTTDSTATDSTTSDGDATVTSTAPDAATTTSATVALPAAPSGRYVALGSSFAAGFLIPTVDPDSGVCLRSDGNYAHLLAARLDLELVDVSCSGATTQNIVSVAQVDAPQIDAVTPDTALITVTVGGNNIGYTDDTFACSATGQEQRSCLGVEASEDETKAALGALPAEMAAMFDALRTAAPDARIVLVAYPRVLPDGGAPCPPSVPLLAQDGAFIAETGAALQQVFQTSASDADVQFIDFYKASLGHDACAAPEERWVSGAEPASVVGPYHPTAEGHIAVATLLEEALTQ